MITTSLSTTDHGILSHKFIPPNAIPMIEGRIKDNTIFGKLQLTVPRIDRLTSNANDEPSRPRNIVAGFVLDTSESMIDGNKLQHAKNTIKNFMDVLLAERNGKTIEDQPFHSWIYVIIFNSTAELVIPFQEITEETVPQINKYLDSIRAHGCTNYERAFQKQTEVLDGIILQLEQQHKDNQQEPVHYHFMRFFETDGEITEGSHNIPKLYSMMRATFVAASAFRLTFEDCVLGYGINVDLSSLKALASPYPLETSAVSGDYNCSALKTILQPHDIGCVVGEILFKTIMRYGVNVEVSVSATTGKIDIFEYQTHQWCSSTKLHSLINGEKKPMWIQYVALEGAPPATIQVRIEFYNQFTGKSCSNTFDHDITSSMIPIREDPSESTQIFQNTSSLILGMIQIEIFKILREIEANRYDRDTIVHEAYKVIRMLHSLNAIIYISFPALASQIQNLMTDAKVIVGLTTIGNPREQNLVLHARRICSAEQDAFNACSGVSRKYVDFEEDYEDVARQIIQEAKAKTKAEANSNCEDDPEEMEQEEQDDVILSRIPTCMPSHSNPHYGRIAASTLRTLCAKIAIARNKKQDITPQQIYDQMCALHRRYDPELDEPSQRPHDDTFSTTPMDDEYMLRRMGMMRQMSS
jgi:uncharacterized protein YegL